MKSLLIPCVAKAMLRGIGLLEGSGSGLLLDGDPDGAVVVGVGHFPVHAVVPLHGGVPAEFVVGVAGQPFGEDAGVHALERLGVGADAVEHGPLVARELVDDHALGDGASGVPAGDQIAESVRAEVVDADAVFADAVVHERLLVGSWPTPPTPAFPLTPPSSLT